MNKIVAAVGMATLSLGVLAEDNVAKYMWDGNAGNLNLADSGNWYLDGTQDGEKQRGLPNLSEDSDFKYRTDRAVLKDLSRFETRKLELAQWGGIAQIDVTNATMKVVNNLMIGCGGGSAAVREHLRRRDSRRGFRRGGLLELASRLFAERVRRQSHRKLE